MAMLRRTPPWSGSGSSGGTSTSRAVPTGRRRRQEWSHGERLALQRGVAPYLPGVHQGRIDWLAVAHKVGNGRTNAQCKDMRQRMKHAGSQEDSEEEPEEEEEERQRRAACTYSRWSEGDVDVLSRALEELGVMLAAARGFPRAARSFPAKLDAAVRPARVLLHGHCSAGTATTQQGCTLLCPSASCSALCPCLCPQPQCAAWLGVPLQTALPGRSRKQVVDKCVNIVTFALKVRRGRGGRHCAQCTGACRAAGACRLVTMPGLPTGACRPACPPLPQPPRSWHSTKWASTRAAA